jgi:hypothetical protein
MSYIVVSLNDLLLVLNNFITSPTNIVDEYSFSYLFLFDLVEGDDLLGKG